MTLKDIVVNELVNNISNLPPLLKEEVIQKSLYQIEKDIRKRIIKEESANISKDIYSISTSVFNDIVNGEYVQYKSDDILYNTSIDIAKCIYNQRRELYCSQYTQPPMCYINNSDDETDDYLDYIDYE